MTVDLSGKVALVTGARAGIGAAIAAELARCGATVAATGRRRGDCAEVVAAITAGGGSAFDEALDVADLGSIGQRVSALVARTGRLDIIVNNAALIEPMVPVAELDAAAFDLAMRTNISGPAAIVIAAWPHLAGSRIVNILSGAALAPVHGWAAYCTSKAALLMLTRAIDLEGAARSTRCFGLAPGLVDTAMQERIRLAHINAISELPRSKLRQPGDAARAVAWLASGAGDGYAGTMVDVRSEEFRMKAGLPPQASN